MRLNEAQKEAVLANCLAVWAPGLDVELVRVGDFYAAVYRNPALSPGERWRGLLTTKVLLDRVSEFLDKPVYTVVWTGDEAAGRTRREVVEQLRMEALA